MKNKNPIPCIEIAHGVKSMMLIYDCCSNQAYSLHLQNIWEKLRRDGINPKPASKTRIGTRGKT